MAHIGDAFTTGSYTSGDLALNMRLAATAGSGLQTVLSASVTDGVTNRHVFSCPGDSVTFSHHLQWDTSGSGVATPTSWSSNKPNPNESSDTDWVQNESVTILNLTGSAGKMMIYVNNHGASHTMLKMTLASGGGVTYSIFTNSKTQT